MPTLLVVILAAMAAFFVVILPGLILAGWLLMEARERKSPPANLCQGADLVNPAAKPCWVSPGESFCETHFPTNPAETTKSRELVDAGRH